MGGNWHQVSFYTYLIGNRILNKKLIFYFNLLQYLFKYIFNTPMFYQNTLLKY
ncbi:hypothetical protein H311_01203 [Anncaliia algerae PRA109]|nr:hypothetical protein H311_01203 [Anncaliia algerae PRA109]